MATKKKSTPKQPTENKVRSRTFMLLLYPEDQTHVEAIRRIEQSYDYALILHDKDKWTAEDEKKNPDHKEGEIKKPHWHVVLRFPQARWSSALAKELDIAPNYIEETKRLDNALQYLIHYNDEDKTKYEIREVKGNLRSRLQESINNLDKSEGEKVFELIQYIKDYEGRLTITDFASYCALNGYWSEFRRSGAIFCKIIDEKNGK